MSASFIDDEKPHQTLDQLHRTIHFLSCYGASFGYDAKDRSDPMHELGDALKVVLLRLHQEAEQIKDRLWPSAYQARSPSDTHHGKDWWLF